MIAANARLAPEAPLAELRRVAASELGPPGEALAPLFDEVQALLDALDPPPAALPLPPDAQAAARARLTELLDTLEDRMDALRLSPAARAQGKGGR